MVAFPRPFRLPPIGAVSHVAINWEEKAPALAWTEFARDRKVSIVDQLLQGPKGPYQANSLVARERHDPGSVRAEGGMRQRRMTGRSFAAG